MARNEKKKSRSDAKPQEERPEATRPDEGASRASEQPLDQTALSPPPIPDSVDKVDEASMESFPASDPPGYGTGHAGRPH